MSSGWSSLPLLPLSNILEHLSLQDALAAMSISRHWRNGLHMYEGRRKSLTLHATQFDKSAFLARIFKKHVHGLYVYIADCSHEQLSRFMKKIMPQFFDSLNLQEIIIVGAGCVQQTAHANVKVNRMIIESLVFKHSHSMHRFALMNCEMDTAPVKMKDINEKVEFYARGLRFNVPSEADAILSRNNAKAMMFAGLQHIIVDYDQITTDTLETLSHLTSLSQLSAIVCNKKLAPQPVDWRRALSCFPNGLGVALNLIALSTRKLDVVMQKVMVEDMQLTSLKVMFCKTFHSRLLKHAVRVHKDTLRELVWTDAPHDPTVVPRVARFTRRAPEVDGCNVNPIILLCWQCTQLTRLVVHGYWMWQYDIIGFVRLRKSLEQMDISAVFGRHKQQPAPANMERVHIADAHDCLCFDTNFLREVNEFTDFEWKPTPLSDLHPALRVGATPEQRSDYIVQEIRSPLGFTLH